MTRADFLAAIDAEPFDIIRREVYADWLDESPDAPTLSRKLYKADGSAIPEYGPKEISEVEDVRRTIAMVRQACETGDYRIERHIRTSISQSPNYLWGNGIRVWLAADGHAEQEPYLATPRGVWIVRTKRGRFHELRPGGSCKMAPRVRTRGGRFAPSDSPPHRRINGD